MATLMADALPLWLEHLRGQGLSAGTVRRHELAVASTGKGLLGAAQKLKGPQVTMGQLDQSVIDAYFAAHTGTSGHRANKLESVKKFLLWAENRKLLRPGLTAQAILDGYKGRKGQRKPKIYIPPERFGELLETAGHPRDRAALAIALYTLARASEISGATLGKLDLDGRMIHLWRQKRQRETDDAIPLELHTEIVRWLRIYAEKAGYADYREMMADHPDWLLVPAKQDRYAGGREYYWTIHPEVQNTTMAKIVHRVLARMELDQKGEGFHTIRRSGARALFRHLLTTIGYEGALTFVQAKLDHEDPKQTLVYIGMNWVREQVNDYLLHNPMYGPAAAPAGGNIVPIRKATANG